MMSSVISTGAMGILMAEKNDRLEQDGDKDYTAPSATEGGIKARAHTQRHTLTHTHIDTHTQIHWGVTGRYDTAFFTPEGSY